jgi:hypothetical protein
VAGESGKDLMRERLTSSTASNWVDRGQPPEPELGRVLSYYLDLGPEPLEPRLRPHVEAIRGMVEADATEVQLAGYLKTIEQDFGVTDSHSRRRRAAAIALWHIAKCAEVRERARRLLEFGIPG